jgi:hypothetical protein
MANINLSRHNLNMLAETATDFAIHNNDPAVAMTAIDLLDEMAKMGMRSAAHLCKEMLITVSRLPVGGLHD